MATTNNSPIEVAQRLNEERMTAVAALERAILLEREAEAALTEARAEVKRATTGMERAGWTPREIAQMGVGKAPARRRRKRASDYAASEGNGTGRSKVAPSGAESSEGEKHHG